MPNVQTTILPGAFGKTLQGTRGEDIVNARSINSGGQSALQALNLADFTLRRVDADTFILDPVISNIAGNIRLDGYDGRVDKIRTVQGDFTLDEILAHGNNAPYYKQARINRGQPR